AAVAANQRRSDHPGAGRDVEHAIILGGIDPCHHRAPPARVLAEAEHRAGRVVPLWEALEEGQRVLLAWLGDGHRGPIGVRRNPSIRSTYASAWVTCGSCAAPGISSVRAAGSSAATISTIRLNS